MVRRNPLRRSLAQSSDVQRLRYANRISGPLDQFDLGVRVERPNPSELLRTDPRHTGDSSFLTPCDRFAMIDLRLDGARFTYRFRGTVSRLILHE